MPTKFGKTMKMNQGDTAGDLKSTVWKDRWNVRGSWIYTTNQRTALSLMSIEIPQNGSQYTTVTDRHMRYVAKPDCTTYIYWTNRGMWKWKTCYSSTSWNLTFRTVPSFSHSLIQHYHSDNSHISLSGSQY